MSISTLQLFTGVGLAAVIAAAAFFARSLDLSGAIAAFVLGTIIFGVGGFSWSILLLAFFLSSSILSRLFRRRKQSVQENFAKGSRRDAGQVAANGAIAGIITLLFAIFEGPVWLWAAFAGTLAAVNADTWSTELGVLSKTPPRLITTGQKVAPGTSGGISLTGTLASVGGAGFIAIPAVLFSQPPAVLRMEQIPLLFLIIIVGGLLGSLFDSYLGATVQAIYFCSACQKQTEKHPVHSCGNPTRISRGSSWLNNDWVNTFCGLSGAIVAGLLAYFLLSIPSNSSAMALDRGEKMTTISISSPVITQGQTIPPRYTCSGEDISPELNWSGIPPETKSLAIIMDDPDAPMGTYTHWVVYNLPSKLSGLPESVSADNIDGGGTQGLNTSRKNGYMGPCPPPGKAHRYFFKIYALDLEPNLPQGLSADKLSTQMSGHILASGELMGTFQR